MIGQQCWGAQAGMLGRSFTGCRAARKWPEPRGVLAGGTPRLGQRLRWSSEGGLAGGCPSTETSEQEDKGPSSSSPPQTMWKPPQNQRTKERSWRESPRTEQFPKGDCWPPEATESWQDDSEDISASSETSSGGTKCRGRRCIFHFKEVTFLPTSVCGWRNACLA